MRTLGVIPARGGSKGLPGKNLRQVHGRPLIAYTVAAARSARTLERVIVSTDHADIAQAARAYGAEVPFLRPRELAGDDTPTLPVLQHAVEEMDRLGYRCEVIVTLQPTSPLRTADDIDRAVALLADGGCDSVVSLVESPAHPSRMRLLDDGLVRPLMGPEFVLERRQDSPPVYAENGAIYVTRRDVLMERGVILGPKTKPLIMPRERSLDIDDEIDLALLELMIARMSRDQERGAHPC